jgi:hypothetical protein
VGVLTRLFLGEILALGLLAVDNGECSNWSNTTDLTRLFLDFPGETASFALTDGSEAIATVFIFKGERRLRNDAVSESSVFPPRSFPFDSISLLLLTEELPTPSLLLLTD